MNAKFRLVLSCLAVVGAVSGTTWATDGDLLIGYGAIDRAMGGVGIVAPQDVIVAVFTNPAALAFGRSEQESQFDFAATFLQPTTRAHVTTDGSQVSAKSGGGVYAIPAFGLTVPLSKPRWRLGLAGYGQSGLAVDYRNTALDDPTAFTVGSRQLPLIAGTYASLSILKFSIAAAYIVSDRLSFGMAAQVDYGTLDLGRGGSSDYGAGAKVGVVYRLTDSLSLGAAYESPQEITYDRVADFDGDGDYDSLDLASPQVAGVGLAWSLLGKSLLLESNAKWIDWSGAEGYSAFDWRDQWVVAVGVQYKATGELALRAGYHWADNPVREHHRFDGMGLTDLQGAPVPTYYYETYRVIGLPAILTNHVTAGLGYSFSDGFEVNLSYMHAFRRDIAETGTNIVGRDVTVRSSNEEDSLSLGLLWKF